MASAADLDQRCRTCVRRWEGKREEEDGTDLAGNPAMVVGEREEGEAERQTKAVL
jgi:hypothetical protein